MDLNELLGELLAVLIKASSVRQGSQAAYYVHHFWLPCAWRCTSDAS